MCDLLTMISYVQSVQYQINASGFNTSILLGLYSAYHLEAALFTLLDTLEAVVPPLLLIPYTQFSI